MSEVVVIAELTAHPGKEADAEQMLSELLAPSHADAGCRLYALHRGIDDPQRFTFVERWASRTLLEQHIATKHIQDAIAGVPQFFSDGPDITVYEALPGGEDDKGSIAGHAAG
jgi:quinol monooxygenase YgiN